MENLFLGGIFFLAAFTQGVSGFGAALVAMPLLTMFLDVQTATPLCMLNGLLITSFLTIQMKSHIDWRKIRPLFLSCLPGILAGVGLLKVLDSNILKVLLGLLIAIYGVYSLASSPRILKLHRAWSYLAGFLTGVIGTAFSAGGPPVVIYLSLSGWSKDEIKATLSAFFFTTGVLTALAHAAAGLTNRQVLSYLTVTLAFTFAGVVAGSRLYRKIDRQTYIRTMLILLVGLGVLMTYAGVTAP